MAKPQLEDGYTQIANEILERLVRMHLAPNQWQVLLCIIRKTYGFHKKVDYIANFQIGNATGLGKTVVSRALHDLLDLGIITKAGKYIGFQKDWERWKGLIFQPTFDEKLAIQPTFDPERTLSEERQKQSHNSARWQARVFHRDGLTCRICHRNADTLAQSEFGLEAHHIFPWAEYPKLRFDVNNGLTMCEECHYCYHYADERNKYEYLTEVFQFRKLAEQLTIKKLAILHKIIANRSQKVSSPEATQKIKDTIQKKPIYIPYPEYANVNKMTEEQHHKMIERFGEVRTKDMVENLSLYIASKGDKYKDHYATILSWEKKDRKEAGHGTHQQSPKKLPEQYTRPEDL